MVWRYFLSCGYFYIYYYCYLWIKNICSLSKRCLSGKIILADIRLYTEPHSSVFDWSAFGEKHLFWPEQGDHGKTRQSAVPVVNFLSKGGFRPILFNTLSTHTNKSPWQSIKLFFQIFAQFFIYLCLSLCLLNTLFVFLLPPLSLHPNYNDHHKIGREGKRYFQLLLKTDWNFEKLLQ